MPLTRLPESPLKRLWHAIIGTAKDPHDPNLTHQLSLVAFLAWVGLGVDGLSSSAYGPEEAYRALGSHTYLAVMLMIATSFTVLVISVAYSKLIEQFPHGGGGYLVATQILGKSPGVISGCALLVDYVLTITVSIASGGDAIFSLLPLDLQPYKLPFEAFAILFLVFMNMRGLKESVKVIVPFFLLFIVTHAIVIFGGIGIHLSDFPALYERTKAGYESGISTMGKWGLFLLFLRAYSFGGGTYTGIEAVSNGVGTLREPRVATGKRTMAYLALSLSITAGGLLLCYMLYQVVPVEGRTLNALLVDQFAGHWEFAGIPIGKGFVWATVFSECVLLFVAAQTGFIDGPRVMANMAVDSWLPRRFAALSDRLTMHNGIFIMGLAALATLLYTQGHITLLVVMYSINVFITFSMTEAAMVKFWISERKDRPNWKSNLALHSVGFLLCFSILWVMILEKFLEGAWATVVITSVFVFLAFVIKRHYLKIGQRIKHIEGKIREVTRHPKEGATPYVPEFDPTEPVAAILVGGYSKLGRRSLLAVLRAFPKTFKNVVFLSVGVVNSEFFHKGDVSALEHRTEETLKGYEGIANRLGLAARHAFRIGTDVVQEASQLCLDVSKDYPQAIFFAGELVFENPHWFDRLLHNETAYAIQRQIRHAGLAMVILPLVLHEEEPQPSELP
ncbi:MAG: APC family permease [Proteobacteria bacterium]|nr:APC family permease [Pseudomonadota bacterium]